MSRSIRTILWPFTIINYVFGLRIIEFPAGYAKLGFNLLYILLFWSIYGFLLIHTVLSYIVFYSIVYHICLQVNIITVLMSIVSEVHYKKKLRDCLNKLAIIDGTLENLGTTTDYQKLLIRVKWFVLGWCIICILTTYGQFLWFGDQHDLDIVTSIYIIFMLNLCNFINFIGDIEISSILGYVGLKFDQINEYLQQLLKDNKLAVKQTWENPALHLTQGKFPKTLHNEWIMWIVIHLYVELYKISHEINTIFEIQMTLKMGCYFGYVAWGLREIFNSILINNYMNKNIVYFVMSLFKLSLYAFRLFLINCICEKVSNKANTTRDFIIKISHSTSDVKVQQNVSQLLLRMNYTPLRFHGLGLFQFGFKFLHGFSKYIATVLVILIQAHVHTEISKK